jgi:phosphatidylglycerol:prolipoprotein diacylglycerol transferase
MARSGVPPQWAQPVILHLVFDGLAAVSAFTVTALVIRWRLRDHIRPIADAGAGYAAALLLGAIAGGFALGSLNLAVSGRTGIGRSLIGALLGAVVAIEGFKRVRGIRGSTGLIFVPALCTTVVVGRVGCFLSGIDDFTYGTPTTLPWAHDFGDSIARHPVQLYEAAAMAAFLALALIALGRRSAFFLRNGFYLMTGWYAIQRYAWEFLKPYGTLWAEQNVFHVAALALGGYAVVMMGRTEYAFRRA